MGAVGNGGRSYSPDRDALGRRVLSNVRGPQEDAGLEGPPGGPVGQVQDAGEFDHFMRTLFAVKINNYVGWEDLSVNCETLVSSIILFREISLW